MLLTENDVLAVGGGQSGRTVMGPAVVVVETRGLPVSNTELGSHFTVAENGIGLPVTLIGTRGLPVRVSPWD